MTKKTGKCLCGAVTVTAEVEPDFGACHCSMCRKWSGGIYFGAKSTDVTFGGEEHIATYSSSPWAERGFCKTCGTNLFYRVTAPGPHQGEVHLALGVLDDVSDMKVTEEIFIDRKPDAYALAGDTKKMTEAEIMAMFAPSS